MNDHLAKKAAADERDYITPEDVQDAIDEGVPKIDLWDELLAIAGRQRNLGMEDLSLCCFVAWEYKTTSQEEREENIE